MSEFDGNICDLPPELQHEILGKLTDVNDFQSAINTCPLWHDIMEYRKTAMLFAQVLPILIEKESYYDSKENMLPLRQVSKDWKRETDRQLTLYPFGWFLEDEGKGYSFSEVEVIQRFLTQASTLPDGVNPILGNAVSLSILDDDDLAPVFQLIRQYGTYIKTISLGSGIDNFPLNQLQSMLNLLPNVEWLIICVLAENWNEVEAPVLPPLPLLTKLTLETEISEYFTEHNYIQTQALFGSLLAAYGPQLENITCSPALLRVESISDRLPNVTSLVIDEIYTCTTFTDEDLNTLAQSGWELKYLEIRSFGKPHVQGSTELMMDMLNTFRRTLVSLDLSFELGRRFDPSRLLVFPCLEIVNLRVSSMFDVLPEWMRDSLNIFSVVCPNLKKLVITTEGRNMNDNIIMRSVSRYNSHR